MEKTDRTKRRLSKTLKELSRSIPLKSISVQKLVAACGLNRGTFYYHFRDIQNLINWTYHADVTVPAHQFIMQCADNETLFNISRLVLNATYQEREFYSKAIAMGGQNSLYDFILQENLSNWQCLLDKILKRRGPGGLDGMGVFCASRFFCLLFWRSFPLTPREAPPPGPPQPFS